MKLLSAMSKINMENRVLNGNDFFHFLGVCNLTLVNVEIACLFDTSKLNVALCSG